MSFIPGIEMLIVSSSSYQSSGNDRGDPRVSILCVVRSSAWSSSVIIFTLRGSQLTAAAEGERLFGDGKGKDIVVPASPLAPLISKVSVVGG